ncbi:MAG: hypothetical protein WD065_16435 [Planctomycetaceae bacterium]
MKKILGVAAIACGLMFAGLAETAEAYQRGRVHYRGNHYGRHWDGGYRGTYRYNYRPGVSFGWNVAPRYYYNPPRYYGGYYYNPGYSYYNPGYYSPGYSYYYYW